MSDMRPGLAANNVADVRLVDAETLGDDALRHTGSSKRSNLQHGIIGQFGRTLLHAAWFIFWTQMCVMLLSFWGIIALALSSITSIICWRSCIEMRRVDAAWHIAGMAHEQPVRNRSIVQLVGKTVYAVRHAVDLERSVPHVRRAGTPYPTIASPINMLPEALFWCPKAIVVAITTTVFTVSSCKVRRGDIKRFRANLAKNVDSLWSGRGNLVVHLDLLRGVMLPAITSSAGAFACLHYSTNTASGGYKC